MLVTADGAWRRGAVVALKDIADEALADTPSIEHVLVLRRTEQRRRDDTTAATSGGTTSCPAQPPTCACEEMDSEDLLYLLYTSGTTGKPKGIMHTTGGYLTQCAYTHKHVFDLHPDTDVYWCTADVGWVTGHSYIVYGPLANRTTSVLYEGTPDFPDKDRLWSIVEKYKVTIFYTAPTAIRTFMKWGDEYPAAPRPLVAAADGNRRRAHQPRGVGLVLRQTIGGGRCPVVDTWWQTETGAIMISALPGATTLKPGSATFPLPGHPGRHRRRRRARPVGIPGGGYLVLERPWPSMLRGIWGDPRALPRHVLEPLRRQVLRGRRRQARRRGLLLAARPRRRHHARVGSQHLHDRGRVRARRPSRRWPKPRSSARPTTRPARRSPRS